MVFKFKGVSNTSMHVIPEEEDFTGRATQRVEEINIDGRDGAIFNELGYSTISKSVNLQVLDISLLDDIYAWLNGAGIFEYKDRVTTARFYDACEVQRAASIHTINATFIRDPFWYRKNDPFILVKDRVLNSGNTSSAPIIRLEGNAGSTVDITIANIRFSYRFDDAGYVEIDCDKKTETANGFSKSKNINIGFEYPTLVKGSNQIKIHSGNAVIKIKRKDRWL